MSSSHPRLSIGLPVYNGERYLEQAITSILNQTFTAFELIIADNASTDRTQPICEKYAAADGRVRYYRHMKNLGAARNYNFTFEHARGYPYFKWSAHDDYLAPTFLETCVDALDCNTEAVLAAPITKIVDGDGKILFTHRSIGPGATTDRPARRLKARLFERKSYEVFGIVRHDAMAKSMLHGSYIGADRVLLGELALMGPFVLVEEPLFFNREHRARSVRIRSSGGSRKDLARWYDPRRERGIELSTWRTYRDYFRWINKHVPSRWERLRCYAHVVRSLRYRWAGVFLILEPLSAISPGALDRAKELRGWFARLVRGHSRSMAANEN